MRGGNALERKASAETLLGQRIAPRYQANKEAGHPKVPDFPYASDQRRMMSKRTMMMTPAVLM